MLKLKELLKETNPWGISAQNLPLPDKKKALEAVTALETAYKQLDEYYGTVLKTLSKQQQEENPDLPDELPDISSYLNTLYELTEKLKNDIENVEDFFSQP